MAADQAKDRRRHPSVTPVCVGSAPVGNGIAGPPAAGLLGTAATALGRRLAQSAPGPALARLLADIDPDTTSDADLVEATAAASRQEAWTHSRTARFASALAHRPSMNPAWSSTLTPRPEHGCVAGEELALRLGVSVRAARTLVREGVAYDGQLADTGRALAAGRLDVTKARMVVARLDGLPWEITDPVEERILPDADHRTSTQLRRDLERALIELDARTAITAHQDARTRRRVEHPRPLPDGMASMWCVMTAIDAARMDCVLNHAARAARSLGDPRTLDQLRADGLRDLVIGDHHPHQTPTASPRHIPPPATTTRTDPQASPDIRRTHPPTTDATDATDDVPSPRVRAVVQVTVPLDTLLGLGDGPGDLAGHSAIDAGQARDLAFSAGGVWRRIVTDPLSGTVLDVGRTRYRPPAALADHVRARDRRCGRPGCTVPAERCDLDHTIEFHSPPAGAPPDQQNCRGITADTDLAPLCPRDHRLKTDGGFVLRQPEPGLLEWTTPTGNRYRLRPGDDHAYQRLTPVKPGSPIDVGNAVTPGKPTDKPTGRPTRRPIDKPTSRPADTNPPDSSREPPF